MADTVLIVEDEPDLSSLLKDYIEASGFLTHVIDNGRDVVDWVRTNKPNLLVLDLMLPGKSGLDICKELRVFSNVPIIMATARVEEIDRLLGLELGADDYICKPYSPREVVARVKSVLRRSKATPQELVQGVEVDEAACQVRVHGKDADLTTVEFKLFKLLFDEPGRIFSRDQIMDHIYRDYRVVSDRTIDSHVKKVRKKLSFIAPDLELIHSIYGAGYKFVLSDKTLTDK